MGCAYVSLEVVRTVRSPEEMDFQIGSKNCNSNKIQLCLGQVPSIFQSKTRYTSLSVKVDRQTVKKIHLLVFLIMFKNLHLVVAVFTILYIYITQYYAVQVLSNLDKL